MSKNKKDLNEFEKQMEEVNEWQKNSTNPGHFIGTGKVPIPIRNLFRSPVIMIVVGILWSIIPICNIANDFCLENVLSGVILIVPSCGFIIGGLIRILTKHK